MAINQVIPRGVDLSKYVGQWVVICDSKVVANAKNLNHLSGEIKKCKTVPTIAKIPKHETLIF